MSISTIESVVHKKTQCSFHRGRRYFGVRLNLPSFWSLGTFPHPSKFGSSRLDVEENRHTDRRTDMTAHDEFSVQNA